MKLKTKIIRSLKKTDGYVSGEALANEYGVSRQSVNKAVSALEREGYGFEKVRNRGYRLLFSPPFDREDLESRFPQFAFLVLDSTDSTNSEAQRLYLRGVRKPVAVIARSQTAGRGRKDSAFPSPADKGIYLSALTFPALLPSELNAYSERIYDAAADALGCKRQDQRLFCGEKHAGGVLIEHIADADRILCLIVGVGIYSEALPAGSDPAGSVLSALSDLL